MEILKKENELLKNNLDFILNLYNKIILEYDIENYKITEFCKSKFQEIMIKFFKNIYFFQNQQIKKIKEIFRKYFLIKNIEEYNFLSDIISFIFYDLKIIFEDYYFYL